MKTNVSYNQYDLGIEGKGHTHFKSVYWLLKQASITFLLDSVQIWNNDCIWRVRDH